MYRKYVEWLAGRDVEATSSLQTKGNGVMFQGSSVTDTELPGAPHKWKCLKDCVALKVCLEPWAKEKESVFFERELHFCKYSSDFCHYTIFLEWLISWNLSVTHFHFTAMLPITHVRTASTRYGQTFVDTKPSHSYGSPNFCHKFGRAHL